MKSKLSIFLKHLKTYFYLFIFFEIIFLIINFLVYIFDTNAELFYIITDTRVQLLSLLAPLLILILHN